MAWRWTWLLLAFVTCACASTGAVPRPFPGAATAYRPPAPREPDARGTTGDLHTAGPIDTYALVGTALSLRGIRYRNGGSGPDGFDCSGFTQYVFARYGLALPRDVREQFREGRQVDAGQLAPGDLVFFSTTDPGASHVGIVIGSDQFVHAPSSDGVVRVERLRASYWSQRFIGARRIVDSGQAGGAGKAGGQDDPI
jgi:cell wall-associated NlpC family hydrolase